MGKNYNIVNKEPSTYWKEHYNNSEGYRLFKRIQKKQYVREYLYKEYGGVCQFCDKPLKENYMIHHTSYGIYYV